MIFVVGVFIILMGVCLILVEIVLVFKGIFEKFVLNFKFVLDCFIVFFYV